MHTHGHDLAHSGKSKIERYGWELTGEPGKLVWLNKSQLQIDMDYQRNANTDRAVTIAKNWNWVACGVLTVAKRSASGTVEYYVIDGQHRCFAALKRSDISTLPCIVFELANKKAEAAGFYATNTGRRMPTTLDKWKALLMVGDPATVFADALIHKAGRVASSTPGPNNVRCLTSIMREVNADRDRLQLVWPLVVELCHGETLHERLFDGLLWLEGHMPDGESLMDKRWRDRVLRVGFKELLAAAQRAATFYARGGAKVWGMGMLEAINKGCRIHLAVVE